jgi:hypothetical protein
MKPTPGMNVSRQIIRGLKPLIDKFPDMERHIDRLLLLYCVVIWQESYRVRAHSPEGAEKQLTLNPKHLKNARL